MCKLKRQLLTVIIAGSAFFSGQIFAVVIGFEGVAPDGGTLGFGTEEMPGTPATPHYEEGFVLSTTEESRPGPYVTGIVDSAVFESEANLIGNGSDMYVFCGTCFQVVSSLAHEKGNPFSLISLDIGSIILDYLGPDESLVVTGNLFGGGTVIQTLPLELNLFPTFALGPEFTNLTSVSFTASLLGNATIFGLDNIVVSSDGVIHPVPAPGTLPLFFSGLWILGLITWHWKRRDSK